MLQEVDKAKRDLVFVNHQVALWWRQKSRRIHDSKTSSLRPRGWARDNDKQAAGEKILIRDEAVVVVTGSETGRPGSLLVLIRSVLVVECKWDRTGTVDLVLYRYEE
jgi:hypothetical protein